MDAETDEIAREQAYEQAGVIAPPLRKATEKEKNLLRSSIVRKATTEEADAWLSANIRLLSQKAQKAFEDMNDEDKFRVMSEGPMRDAADATEILYGRVKRFMDMEAKLRAMANSTPNVVEKPKEKKISSVALSIAQSMSMPKLEEVPEHERRTAGYSSALPESELPKVAEKALMGTRVGVGGVIEALQKKYTMQKGERARVVAETKELWKMEGDRNVPKVHRGSGWKWVLQGEEEAEKKKAEEKAQKQKEKGEAEKNKAEGGKRKREDERKEDSKKNKDSKTSRHNKGRGCSRSCESSSASLSKPRKDRRSKQRSTARRKDDNSSDQGSTNDRRAASKTRDRKRSPSSGSGSRRRRRKR